VLQCVAVCCSVLQCATDDKLLKLCMSTAYALIFDCPASSPLMPVAVWCSTVQRVAVCCGVLQSIDVCIIHVEIGRRHTCT